MTSVLTNPSTMRPLTLIGLNATLVTRHLLIRPPAVEVIGHLQAFAEGR